MTSHALRSAVAVLFITAAVSASDTVQIKRLGSVALAGGGAVTAFLTVNGNPYLIAGNTALSLVNMRYPASPTVQATYTITGGTIRGIDVWAGSTFIAAGDAGFFMFSLLNPAVFQISGYVQHIGNVSAIAVNDSLAVVYNYPDVSVIDFRKPLGPRRRGSASIFGRNCPVALAGRHAYVGNRKRVILVDISNPDSPARVDSFAAPDTVRQIAIAGGYAYISMPAGRIGVYDISQSPRVASAGSIELSASVGGITVKGDYLYIAGSPGYVGIHSITDPPNPLFLGSYAESEGSYVGPAVYDRYIYACKGDTVVALEVTGLAESVRRSVAFAKIGAARRSTLVNCRGQLIGQDGGRVGAGSYWGIGEQGSRSRLVLPGTRDRSR